MCVVRLGTRLLHSHVLALYICLLTLLQEEMKLSLILNVVDPRIGGVMVMGDRGTGKTTAVRALADLLPQLRVIIMCEYVWMTAMRALAVLLPQLRVRIRMCGCKYGYMCG